MASLKIFDHTRLLSNEGYAMLTITFSDTENVPLYEQLYRSVRSSIETGQMRSAEKLPSRRSLAKHLHISPFTVENAYCQLQAEGYIFSLPKKGYFVCDVPVAVDAAEAEPVEPAANEPAAVERAEIESAENAVPARFGMPASFSGRSLLYDLKTNAVDTEHFPYSVWSRLMRECLRGDPALLLGAIDPQGDAGLREEIARYLHAFRGMDVRPEQIVVGAGTEYLIGLITELLPGTGFAFENPGYPKIMKILESRRAEGHPVPVDEGGILIDTLKKTDASAVFVTPSNHFPTGAVMGIGRRSHLLQWASEKAGRYIVEDDFDSEFRFVLKPIPALHSLDKTGKVIYMNSFAKTLAPSLRIAYMVLPEALLGRYREKCMFYSCTVSQFEQLTLKLFLQKGYYERHLNRMKTIYRDRKEVFLEGMAKYDRRGLVVKGQEAGLHLVLKISELSESFLVRSAREKGVGVYPLSGYCVDTPPETHTVVVGHAETPAEGLGHAAALLCEAWGNKKGV